MMQTLHVVDMHVQEEGQEGEQLNQQTEVLVDKMIQYWEERG